MSSLRKSNGQLRGQVGHLENEANRREEFDKQLAPATLSGRLPSRRVLVLAMPGSDGKHVQGVVDMLKLGGATIIGPLQFSDAYTDPNNNDVLLDLATQAAPIGVTGLPNNSDGPQTSAALLAAVLLDRRPPLPAGAETQVLTAYTTARMVVEMSKVNATAEAVVMVTGSPFTDADAAKRNAAVVSAVGQFDRAGPIVVAGPGTSGDGNPVAAVRGNATLNQTVSTVDSVSTVQGQIATVLALEEQLAGHAGRYGIGDGATALVPRQQPS